MSERKADVAAISSNRTAWCWLSTRWVLRDWA
jgi:hypothetical protein